MTRPAALLLDVMGTLVHDPFYVEVPVFFGMNLRELVKVVHPTSWIDFEHGVIDEATYLSRFFLDGRAVDGAGLKRCMASAFRYLDGIEPLLAELVAAGAPMYALSNYSPWYALIEERLRLSRYVSWSFVSCDTGHRKPAPEAYTGAAQRLSLTPEACLFVDDRPPNCEGARAVGMPALHFTRASELREVLVEHGLLPT